MFVVAALSLQCHQSAVQPGQAFAAEPARIASMSPIKMSADDENAALAKRDPIAFFEKCLANYRAKVDDYSCVFAKQEQLGGSIKPLQKAEVRFREEPFSVDMEFFENVREAKRALYVAGKWYDSDGVPQVWAKPGGAILRAIVPRIQQPVAGARAKKASRRTIDQFGFGRTLELIIQYSRKAQAEGKLKLSLVGEGEIDGRPTYVFKRDLPYDGNEDDYPDNLLVVHIDKEWLLPTGVYAYADEAGENLLGSYVFSDVKLNTGLNADDFDPDKIDF
ncbi:MAG: DUF1571 domain-containing protein [Phycisphaerales bacterium]|nr:DUF1571 domain-containing protein [Phycisphaerales bacterium]